MLLRFGGGWDAVKILVCCSLAVRLGCTTWGLGCCAAFKVWGWVRTCQNLGLFLVNFKVRVYDLRLRSGGGLGDVKIWFCC